jgi:hypothetical protein
VVRLEAEADRMAAQASHGGSAIAMKGNADASLMQRQTGQQIELRANSSMEWPAAVQDAFHSPGKPLDRATRASMEPRFGTNLGGVRIHNGTEAATAARSVNANAFTVGQDIFFGPGRYDPHSAEGRRLLMHELSHTVQQSGGSRGKRLSSAGRGLYRDPNPKGANASAGTTAGTESKRPKTEEITISVPPAQLQNLQLTPPSLLASPQQPSVLSPGTYTLGGSAGSNSLGHPGASLFQPPSQYSPASPAILPPAALYPSIGPPPPAPTTPSLAPTAGNAGSTTSVSAPSAPDRVSIHDFGTLSIGARFGFPDLSKDDKPGDAPSALQESLKQGEVLNFIFTGQSPSAYGVDPGKLVGALWGIFSTQIAPDVAKKIAAGLSSKPTGKGLTYQLDATILFNMGSGSGPGATKTGGGGGATLTILF